MSQTTIIELKQADGEKIQQGEFRSILQDPVYIFDGDQIKVSKVFVDTEKSTDGIVDIPYDIDITTEHISTTVNNDTAKFNDTPVTDNIDYILCDVVGQRSGDPAINATKIYNVAINPSCSGLDTKTYGNASTDEATRFMYVDIGGNLREVYVPVPATTRWCAGKKEPIYVEVDFIAKKNGLTEPAGDPIPKQLAGLNLSGLETTFALVRGAENEARSHANGVDRFALDQEASDHHAGGWYYLDETVNTPTSFAFVKPIIFKNTFTLNKGKYTPQDLCNIITNEYSRNDTGQTFTNNTVVQSQFLQTSTNYTILPSPTAEGKYENQPPGGGKGGVYPANANGKVANKSTNIFMSNMGEQGYVPTAATPNVLAYHINPGFWIGTETLELSYDSGNNKFYWNFLHFPIYDNLAGQISTRRIEISANVDPSKTTYSNQTRNGCVAFTGLSAVRTGTETATSQGEPYDFWKGDLGFDINRIIVAPDKTVTVTDGADSTFYFETYKIQTGINTTSAQNDLDANVAKIDKTDQTVSIRQQPTNQTGGFSYVQSTLNTTVEANSVTVKVGDSLSTPYFLLDLRAGFQTDMHSTDSHTTSIQAVINRYYSKGSFTASEDGFFNYLHKGVPLILTSFHCRFLNPDKTVSDELGDNNSIFIEIDRESDLARFQRQSATQQMKTIQAKEAKG